LKAILGYIASPYLGGAGKERGEERGGKNGKRGKEGREGGKGKKEKDKTGCSDSHL
jgi:hypothetical protein